MKQFLCESIVKRASVISIMAALFISLVVVLSVPPASAQSAAANLSGTVVDPNGQVVPGAAVIIANPATGFRRETITNEDGIYTFLNLAPDTYTVIARRDGFATAENRDVVLNVNDKRSLRIQLSVGDVNAVVQITGESSLVDQSAAVGNVVDRTFFENLPMNGRSFQPLIALSPGVVITPTSSADQGQFSVNGQRTASNSFYVDGVSANFGGVAVANLGQFAGGALPALSAQGGTNALVSVDAVQEFTILTSTYAPEFGRTPGAQISILTRSGNNRFTGSVFEYFRNEKLDANDWFVNATPLTAAQRARGITTQPRLPLRLNNFGGVFGGPVYLPRFGEGVPALWSGKDRTFFFFSYEKQILRLPRFQTYQVPSLLARQTAAPSAQPFVNAYPLPNGPVNATNPLAATFNASFSDPSESTTYGIRIDHNLTSKLQIFGRYSDAPSNRGQRGVGLVSPNGVLDTITKVRTLTLGAIWQIGSNMVNDFRVNHSTNNTQSVGTLDDFGGAVPFSSSAFFTTPRPFSESDSFFQIQALGFPNVGLGTNADNKQRQLNLVNHFSIVKGSHSLKFGGDYRRLSPSFGPRKVSVNVLHNSIEDFVSGQPLIVFLEAGQQGSLLIKNFGLYVQDTWKASPRMTLTYGLRWDVDFAPTAPGELQPVAVTSAGFDDPTKIALAPQGTPLFQTSYNNIAPRVGLAYQIRQKQGWETVLRGGFGVFYDLASQGVGQQITLGQPPFGNTVQHILPIACIRFPQLPPGTCSGAFPLTPQVTPPAVGVVVLPLQNPTFFNPELKQPYTLQWNAAVEQSIGSNQSFSASYVAAAGRRLLRQKLVTGVLVPPGGTPGVTPANFFNPSLVDNDSVSDYHSMQLQFQRRLSRGVQALASYTLAKSTDTASSGQVSVSDSRLNTTDDVDRGYSSFDIRHTFNAGVSYEIPAPFDNRALRAILGGWALDSIFTSRSASPLNVVVTNTFSVPPNLQALSGLRPDLVPGVPIYLFGDQFPGGKALNRAAFALPPLTAGFPARQGNLERNSLRGFGQWQLDTSLRRQFSFSERTKLQLRADLFNIFNNPNFAGVNTAFSTTFVSPTFGRATSMLGRSLGSGGISGGFNPLFQIGGPRSTQLSVKLLF